MAAAAASGALGVGEAHLGELGADLEGAAGNLPQLIHGDVIGDLDQRDALLGVKVEHGLPEALAMPACEVATKPRIYRVYKRSMQSVLSSGVRTNSVMRRFTQRLAVRGREHASMILGVPSCAAR